MGTGFSMYPRGVRHPVRPRLAYQQGNMPLRLPSAPIHSPSANLLYSSPLLTPPTAAPYAVQRPSSSAFFPLTFL